MTTPFKTRYSARQPSKGITFTEESLTLQSEYPATTIDYYLKKYSQTGLLGDPLRAENAQYLDVSEVGDFADMQEKVAQVKQAFEQLPAEERRRYGDDPTAWVEAQVQAAESAAASSESRTGDQTIDVPVQATGASEAVKTESAKAEN